MLLYEDEQLDVNVNSSQLERIPMIVNPATGQILPKFQQFYDMIVRSILTVNVKELYSISDKSLDEDVFSLVFNQSVGKKLQEVLSFDSNRYKIDVEINMDRFRNKYRTILGGFLITIIYLSDESNEMLNHISTSVRQASSELLFTYRNSDFELLSKFDPFVFED